jgi:Tfp pilus assembly protein PilN
MYTYETSLISRSINLKKTCEYCSAYSEKEKNNMLTPEDIERYKGHIASKERAREEKEHAKERAKVNQSVYAAGLWNEKLNSLQKTLLYAMDGAVIISSAVHFAL